MFPAAIEYLAGPVVIHPTKYYAEVGPKGMNAKPVGTGPYRVASYVPGKSITLERNPNYFKDGPKGAAKIDKVEIRFIPDRQTQMAEMLSGGADLIMHVPKDQAEQAAKVPHLQVLSGETMRIAFMQLNTLDNTPTPALKDLRVRKAIAHAIDREAIVKNIVGDGSRVLHTLCFPSQFGCTDQGAAALRVRPGAGEEAAGRGGLPERLRDGDLRVPRAQPDRGDHQQPAAGRHQGQAQLLAVRRHARRDPRRQGLADAPDLGLVLGQRRVGVHSRCGSAASRTTSRATRKCRSC